VRNGGASYRSTDPKWNAYRFVQQPVQAFSSGTGNSTKDKKMQLNSFAATKMQFFFFQTGQHNQISTNNRTIGIRWDKEKVSTEMCISISHEAMGHHAFKIITAFTCLIFSMPVAAIKSGS